MIYLFVLVPTAAAVLLYLASRLIPSRRDLLGEFARGLAAVAVMCLFVAVLPSSASAANCPAPIGVEEPAC